MTKPALTTEIGISEPTIRLATLPSVIRREPWRLSGLAAHPFHGFFWITRGQGRLSLGGHMRGIGPNTLIFVPAGVVHAMEYGPSLQGYVAWLHRDLPVPVRYFDEASSINFKRSSIYALETLRTFARWYMHKAGMRCDLFEPV